MVEQHTQRIADLADLSSIRADILKDSRLKRGIRGFSQVDVDQSQLISYRPKKPRPRINRLADIAPKAEDGNSAFCITSDLIATAVDDRRPSRGGTLALSLSTNG
jgi:hypothetical protein